MDKKLKLKNMNWNWRIWISINDLDINEIVVSNEFPFGKEKFKYLIG